MNERSPSGRLNFLSAPDAEVILKVRPTGEFTGMTHHSILL
jgi:hypothetical protein